MHEQMRAGDEVGAGGGSPARPAHQARPAQQAADRPDLATRFLELHRPGDPLLIPNPFDEGSARLLAHLGFEALATTSSGCAASRGLLDGSVSRDDALAHAALIAAATELPVSADLENGFARQPDEVAETYRLARETGLAGASIEDYDPETGELYDIGLATERVAAAAEASHSGRPGGGRLVLTGRAENFVRGRPDLDDAIARLQAYRSAGADVLYAPLLTDLGAIARVVESLDGPLNVLVRPDGPSVAELASAGVARISVGGAFAFVAYGALVAAARELLEQGTFSWYQTASAGRQAVTSAFG